MVDFGDGFFGVAFDGGSMDGFLFLMVVVVCLVI